MDTVYITGTTTISTLENTMKPKAKKRSTKKSYTRGDTITFSKPLRAGDTVTISKPARYQASNIMAKLAAQMLGDTMTFGCYTPPSVEEFKAIKSKKKQHAYIEKVLKDFAECRNDYRKAIDERDEAAHEADALQRDKAHLKAAIKSLTEVI